MRMIIYIDAREKKKNKSNIVWFTIDRSSCVINRWRYHVAVAYSARVSITHCVHRSRVEMISRFFLFLLLIYKSSAKWEKKNLRAILSDSSLRYQKTRSNFDWYHVRPDHTLTIRCDVCDRTYTFSARENDQNYVRRNRWYFFFLEEFRLKWITILSI